MPPTGTPGNFGVPSSKGPTEFKRFRPSPITQNEYGNPPGINPGRLAMAGILAAWSLVVAVPLFAAVGLQQTPVVPPPRNDKHQEIVRVWEQPQWNAQRAKFTPNKETSADPITFVPFRSKSTHTLWPALEWESQRTRKAPIPDAAVIKVVPFSRLSSLSIALWPQPEWPSQTSLKSPIPDRHDPPAHSFPLLVDRWPQPDWDTQRVRQTPIPDRHDPAAHSFPLLVDRWPQPDWPSQTTRKTPIPDVHDAPPINIARAAFPISQWEPLAWTVKRRATRPIPDTVAAADNPLKTLETVYALVLTWPDIDYPQPRRSVVTPSGPDVAQPPASRRDLSLIQTAWLATGYDQPKRVVLVHGAPSTFPSVLTQRQMVELVRGWWEIVPWSAQRAPRTVHERIDNPPFGQRLWLMPLVQLWEPGPPQPIVHRVVFTPDGPIPDDLALHNIVSVTLHVTPQGVRVLAVTVDTGATLSVTSEMARELAVTLNTGTTIHLSQELQRDVTV